MKSGFQSSHYTDDNGNPDGGASYGNGFAISWQRGGLGRHVQGPDGCALQLAPGNSRGCVPGCTRKEPNGAFVEDVLKSVADRIEYYQTTKFACEDNKIALDHISEALKSLNRRTITRESKKIEGTHAV